MKLKSLLPLNYSRRLAHFSAFLGITLAFSLNVEANIDISALTKALQVHPLSSSIQTAQSFMGSKALLSLNAADQEKVRTLVAVFNNNKLAPEKLSEDDMLRIVRFTRTLQSETRHHPWQRHNLFVHADPEVYKTAIQFYSNGHIYLHAGKKDPEQKHGAHKLFTRVIDFESNTLFANLENSTEKEESPDKKEPNTAKILKELTIMAALEGKPHIETPRDAMVFDAMHENTPIKKINFQTALYDGDLKSTLKLNGQASQRNLKFVLVATAKALKSLHDSGYVHRDLKPQNILIKRDALGYVEKLSLTDFGLALNIDKERTMKALAGTRGYIDPVACFNRMRGITLTKFVAEQADVFSLGATLLSLLGDSNAESFLATVKELNVLALSKTMDKSAKQLRIPALELRLQNHFKKGEAEAEAKNSPLEKLLWEMVRLDVDHRTSLEKAIKKANQL